MAEYVLKIITDLSKLSDRCDEISPFAEEKRVTKIVNDLKDTLIDNPNLVALCAPQLGHKLRIFCIKFANKEIKSFVNPMITKSEGIHLCREFNPSIPGKEYIMSRNDKIILTFQTPTGKIEENIFEGVVAEVIQQQVNMLDGVLLSDFGLEVLPEFDKASKEEQDQVINWWLDSLKEKNEALAKEIDSNEDLFKIKKAIEFMTKVASGEVKTEEVEVDKDGSPVRV